MSIRESNIWPNIFQAETRKFIGICVPLTPPAQTRYQSFAIGFFGFHFIRATNENEPVLQRESQRILNKLVTASHINACLLRDLKNPEKQSYRDFWENVLSKIAFALGDAGGHRIQETVKLGFWMAAMYACMVGIMEDGRCGKIVTNLSTLEDWMAKLLIFARKAEISDVSLNQLVKSKGLLRSTKTCSTAYKCLKNIELLMKENLLAKT